MSFAVSTHLLCGSDKADKAAGERTCLEREPVWLCGPSLAVFAFDDALQAVDNETSVGAVQYVDRWLSNPLV